MAVLTVIGRGVRVRGRIQGEGDLEVAGHVEGEISLHGEVTVSADGLVGANVSGQNILVRGAVRGDLTAEDAVRLEEGARVVGDIRAPRISIAKGALVRGLVQTAALAGAAPRAKAAVRPVHRDASATKPAPAKSAEPVRAPSKPADMQKPAPAPPPPSVKAVAPRPAPPTMLAGAKSNGSASPKGPPPPVVPMLKKGAKGALKKKAT